MAIIYNREQNTMTLHTKNSTYQMLVGKYQYLLHLYYGKRISGSMEHLLTYYDHGFSGNPYEADNDRTFSLDALPQEYSCLGNGDYRSVSFWMKREDGARGCDLRYVSHEILDGKYALEGLPAVYAKEHAQTLRVVLEDVQKLVRVTLLYGVLADEDIITRSAVIENMGASPVTVEKVHSACLDFTHGSYDLIHLSGRYGMERMMEREKVTRSLARIGSRRGTSSHQQNPFVILAQTDTTEDVGLCCGMSLMYSGNFSAEVQEDQFHQTRISMGISEELFSVVLKPGEVFTAPEVILSFSDQGLGQLSRNFHRVIRSHVCRGMYRDIPRPVLINNWEATYFTFTGEKIYQIAKQASELGVEMFVLDDGWFGVRDCDQSGLGDWYVNEKKLGEPLAELAGRINQLGMKFGLWIEPEMVSEDSDLYRAHPEWAFVIPGKKPVRSRYQLVLDFSNREVVDYVFHKISAVLDGAGISYIKMDMNRSICDVYSSVAGKENQGAVLHKYVLGVYDFLERLRERYPELLIEGCSGGGGRFDAGMLYYTPQIWSSDNTDAVERLSIQYGTSFGYPISASGAHVSVVPNEQTGRVVGMETRAMTAMAGSFGYELDSEKLTEEEKDQVKEQIRDFHKYWKVIHHGDYYRITKPQENREIAAWQFVSEDQTEALMNVVTLSTHCNSPVSYVHFKGLDERKLYRLEIHGGGKNDTLNGRLLYGSALMYGGLPVPVMSGEYQPWQVYLVEAQQEV